MRFPIIPLMILGFFLLAINAGDSLYEYDLSQNTTTDIYNYSETHFVWNSTEFAPIYEVNNSHNQTEAVVIRVNNIMNKLIDMFGFTAMETGKLGIEMGYHGEGDYKMIGLLKLIKWILIFMLIRFLLIPLAVVGLASWHSYDWVKKKVLKK